MVTVRCGDGGGSGGSLVKLLGEKGGLCLAQEKSEERSMLLTIVL